MRKIVSAISLLLWIAIASAQTEPEPGDEITFSGPGGSAWPTKVSGTNCNVGVGVHRSGSPTTTVWKRIKLTVSRPNGSGGTVNELEVDRTYGGTGEPPMDASATVSLRFASTHFNDGSTITFKFEAWDAASGGTGTATIQDTKTTEVYNKAISMATQEEYWINKGPNDPIPSGYKLPGEPGHLNWWPSMSRDAANFAKIALAGTLKHTVTPSAAPFDTWRETGSGLALDAEMSKATFFYAATHGEGLLFRASLCDPANRSSDEITFDPEVPAYIARAATIPGYNMVIVNSCHTCASNLAAIKFGMVPANYEQSIYENKVYLGFPSPVSYELQIPTNESLAKHTEKLFDQLSQGLPIRDALFLTQGSQNQSVEGEKRPKGRDSGTALRMAYKGDPFARIRNVYLNSAEWASASVAQRNNWFWVKP